VTLDFYKGLDGHQKKLLQEFTFNQTINHPSMFHKALINFILLFAAALVAEGAGKKPIERKNEPEEGEVFDTATLSRQEAVVYAYATLLEFYRLHALWRDQYLARLQNPEAPLLKELKNYTPNGDAMALDELAYAPINNFLNELNLEEDALNAMDPDKWLALLIRIQEMIAYLEVWIEAHINKALLTNNNLRNCVLRNCVLQNIITHSMEPESLEIDAWGLLDTTANDEAIPEFNLDEGIEEAIEADALCAYVAMINKALSRLKKCSEEGQPLFNRLAMPRPAVIQPTLDQHAIQILNQRLQAGFRCSAPWNWPWEGSGF
jgi:hypothetical protein